ncbi:SRPBCC family protein [Agrococcus sp. Marseille-Q4369]|uniref:SRPBCC family protein n=1 Tax=Agrococcus sp. Marseille-Q4369 TaxID=2810513 RepID=UPI001B8CCE36|nr:SRPBCC family protein [Agrococcus sp. Marseille-Q4369]QUW19768.1 SRPBCC family protein [Agrococcus sp. Marseille-Q4369]
MTQHDAVWSALSHPARRRILDALRERPASTGRLHEAIAQAGLSPSRFATQRHLQVLRDAELVLVTDRGRERENALNASALYQATIGWLDPTSARTAHSLDSVRRLAEAPAREETDMNEFHVRQAIDIAAPVERVWQALVDEPHRWWGSPYLMLEGTGQQLEFPQRAGGAVLERRGDATALWGIVTACEPGRAYAWAGQMGMGPAYTGEARYELEATDAGTRVTLEHDAMRLWGDDDVKGTGSGYDYGWADLNARLKAFVEDGAEHGTTGANAEPEFEFAPST